MSTKIKIFISFISVSFIIGCGVSRTSFSKDKSITYRATIERGQFLFTFPKDSFAFTNREELMKECENALDFDMKILKLDTVPYLIRVHYYNSRGDLSKYMLGTWSGVAEIWKNSIYLVRGEKVKAPTKHEMMHLLSGKLWGFPHPGSEWLNEGLATYAANNCNGFNLEQIYSYYLDRKMLIDLDSLGSSFYKHDDMIAYHQAGYISQWLLEHYGLDKLKELWIAGYTKFENIYGVPYRKVESDIEVY